MNVVTVALAMLETAFGCPKIFHEWPFSVPRSSPGSHTACSHHVSYSSVSDDRFVFFPCLARPFRGGLVRYFSVQRPSFWSVCWFLTVRLGFGDVGKHMTRGEGHSTPWPGYVWTVLCDVLNLVAWQRCCLCFSSLSMSPLPLSMWSHSFRAEFSPSPPFPWYALTACVLFLHWPARLSMGAPSSYSPRVILLPSLPAPHLP